MMKVKYIAVPADDELVKAIEADGLRSGLKLGPQAALRLKKLYKVGPFAPAEKKGSEK